ncbi:unnamed protein product [Mycetohabitans rhizoxinica HKI 454]|uniref:Lasso peptide peptide A n=2 Tax=Mycetohabitans TaxID=2571159 RepID=E5AQE4_MYCRK|nr:MULTISPECIES: burhizin family lasso peptide [Mycetohabitans]MCG1046900.1 hypothetical protein [Mycetohabitans sp. B6]QGY72838.1 lasso peptide precursor peptide A [Mycetohabitans sp.]CBW74826.1 unnamed protein product [Mycetohabitans rhizoxinica HKI 454]
MNKQQQESGLLLAEESLMELCASSETLGGAGQYKEVEAGRWSDRIDSDDE